MYYNIIVVLGGVGGRCEIINAIYMLYYLFFFPQLKNMGMMWGGHGGESCKIINAALYAGQLIQYSPEGTVSPRCRRLRYDVGFRVTKVGVCRNGGILCILHKFASIFK